MDDKTKQIYVLAVARSLGVVKAGNNAAVNLGYVLMDIEGMIRRLSRRSNEPVNPRRLESSVSQLKYLMGEFRADIGSVMPEFQRAWQMYGDYVVNPPSDRAQAIQRLQQIKQVLRDAIRKMARQSL